MPKDQTPAKPHTGTYASHSCGACRKRRVRCDVRDLNENIVPEPGMTIRNPCTHCTERNLHCRFSDAKPTRIQRKGRRIKQVEAVYGLSAGTTNGKGKSQGQTQGNEFAPIASPSNPYIPSPAFPNNPNAIDPSTLRPEYIADVSIFQSQSFKGTTRSRVVIPTLRPQFFNSAFFRRFMMQFPITDDKEFLNRYLESYSSISLTTSPSTSSTSAFKPSQPLGPPGQLISVLLVIWAISFGVNEFGVELPPDLESMSSAISRRRGRCNEMVKEVLHLVDIHGLLRKPTWDGVRALLLLYPLTQDVLSSVERLAIRDTTFSQVYGLCLVSGINYDQQNVFLDALVRARIFWYAHIQDGVASCVRGGRVNFEEETLDAFTLTIPTPDISITAAKPDFRYNFACQLSRIPLCLSAACRELSNVGVSVSGCDQNKNYITPKGLDVEVVRGVLTILENCWAELEQFRMIDTEGMLLPEDADRFISGWQFFIFECLTVILESVKRRRAGLTVLQPTRSAPSSTAPNLSQCIDQLIALIERHVAFKLPLIVGLVRRLISTSFFTYDASLARGGIYSAAHLLVDTRASETDFQVCILALRQMRWAFSMSDETQNRLLLEQRAKLTVMGGVTGGMIRMPVARSVSVNLANLAAQSMHLAPHSVVSSPVSPLVRRTSQPVWAPSSPHPAVPDSVAAHSPSPFRQPPPSLLSLPVPPFSRDVNMRISSGSSFTSSLSAQYANNNLNHSWPPHLQSQSQPKVEDTDRSPHYSRWPSPFSTVTPSPMPYTPASGASATFASQQQLTVPQVIASQGSFGGISTPAPSSLYNWSFDEAYIGGDKPSEDRGAVPPCFPVPGCHPTPAQSFSPEAYLAHPSNEPTN